MEANLKKSLGSYTPDFTVLRAPDRYLGGHGFEFRQGPEVSPTLMVQIDFLKVLSNDVVNALSLRSREMNKRRISKGPLMASLGSGCP